ncbi:hypothetical protein [Paraburkholderia sp.]|uniref:hypothetical protein n=1 Tax=Paraburkholderia sp. TaxID=1926495 RepID=UPI0023937413|nr:hypothetical protein [Paraburkholderia sp.]MDE1184505.1 hypothetical protein [Paraburkholderia sp.]
MTTVNTTMSPNTATELGGTTANSSVTGESGGMSSQKVSEVLAKILAAQNRDFERKLAAAEAAPDKQKNVEMIKVQQAMGSVNVTQSTATACVQGMTDAQKETARASR